VTKKIAVLTLHGYFNYGNRLQNYALVNSLQNMGYDVVSLVVKYDLRTKLMDKRIFNREIDYYINLPKKIMLMLFDIKYQSHSKIKETKLRRFSDEYLNEIFVDLETLENLREHYDYFIAGSDQIWNENFTKDYFYLDFSIKEKNIAYAASIGKDLISDDFKNYLVKKLKNFKAISVREQLGVEIISGLTEKNIKLVLDPTLLLYKNDWDLLAKNSKIGIEEKYLLTYFLGNAPYREIKKVSIEHNLKIVNLYNPKNAEYLSASIEDFLRLFSHASFILTDSFHGTIFSIIYEKKFVVLPREDMNSRIYSILNMFELEDRFNKISRINQEIDYANVKSILNLRRLDSLKFLLDNLD
jgi:hypothetical protein